MARRPVSESFTMLSEQGQQQSFDPAVSFHQSDYSPTMLQQQQHFATGHQQQHQHQKQQPSQQQYHRSARPASEILPQNHHHSFLANNFQSPEGKLHISDNDNTNTPTHLKGVIPFHSFYLLSLLIVIVFILAHTSSCSLLLIGVPLLSFSIILASPQYPIACNILN
ncbi:MAG: hypothetical protein J3R72DRAFT_145476 [Linnemannia gamsii]|nr:MAG: hypothetical protein J3R72DRAFT_145476 [Linnemannia gamsii]